MSLKAGQAATAGIFRLQQCGYLQGWHSHGSAEMDSWQETYKRFHKVFQAMCFSHLWLAHLVLVSVSEGNKLPEGPRWFPFSSRLRCLWDSLKSGKIESKPWRSIWSSETHIFYFRLRKIHNTGWDLFSWAHKFETLTDCLKFGKWVITPVERHLDKEKGSWGRLCWTGALKSSHIFNGTIRIGLFLLKRQRVFECKCSNKHTRTQVTGCVVLWARIGLLPVCAAYDPCRWTKVLKTFSLAIRNYTSLLEVALITLMFKGYHHSSMFSEQSNRNFPPDLARKAPSPQAFHLV